MCAKWQWNALDWCYWIALPALPVVQSSNTVSCVSLSFRTHPCVLAIKYHTWRSRTPTIRQQQIRRQAPRSKFQNSKVRSFCRLIFIRNKGFRILVSHLFFLTSRLVWLVKASDVLYPSVYFNTKTDAEKRPGMVYGAVNVTRSWLEYVGEPHKPIYLYTKTVLEKTPPYYSDVSLIDSNLIRNKPM